MTDRPREIPHERQWREQGEANIETWGRQAFGTLLLAAQEEMGELTQAYLEARAEGEDPERVSEELDDLAALLVQMAWLVEDPEVDPHEEQPVELSE